MTDTLIATITTKQAPDKSREWSSDDRQTAFEVWMLLAGRDIPTVVRLLADPAGPYNIPIPDSTIRYWLRHDQWDIKADALLAATAPSHGERTIGSLAVAALHASSYLVRANSGAVEPTREQTNVAQAALNAAGYGSYSKRAIMQQRDTPSSSSSLRTLTDEELRKLERGEG